MGLLDSVAAVLGDAARPMDAKEITSELFARGLWSSNGKTPQATVEARIAVDVKKHGAQSRFVRSKPGHFALTGGPSAAAPTQVSAQIVGGSKLLSFTDAAEMILRNEGAGKPMHYRDITHRALATGLLSSAGKTPEATLYSLIYQENERRTKRGHIPRFARLGKGMLGLTEWVPGGLADEINKNNVEVKRELLAAARLLTPTGFERLVGTLLSRMGFEDVEVTKVSNDGGIDARGLLVVGEAIRVRMGIQAKKWKANVHSPTVQQVRGSLGAHERGLIITTSDYSDGARKEAARPDAAPVALINGTQLVDLLVEYRMGVETQAHELLTLGSLDNVPLTEGLDAIG